MHLLLAQTATAPVIVTATTTTAPAAPAGWSIAMPDLTAPALTFAGTALVFLLIMIPLRGFLRRKRLVADYLVAVVALSCYHALMAMQVTLEEGTATQPLTRRDGILHFDNEISYWATRFFGAIMLGVALRVIDRLIVVPLLSRGGKQAVPRFLHQMIVIVLALFAILIFGSVAFGWDIDKFLAGSAVVSIVLGLALQESLGNFFSGLVMNASPPFAIGHRIKCAGFEGDVVDMNWRAVTLHTDEDDYVIIPNATVAKSEILNYSVPTRATARFVNVGLEYDLPPADAMAVLKTAVLETPEVLQEPAPVIFLLNFGDSAIEYSIKFWIENAREHEIIQHNVRVHLWYRLRERGYNIPFPIRTVEHSSHAAKSRQIQDTARSRRIEAIRGVPLLSPLNAEQTRTLADSTNEVYLASGQVLFRQGDAGSSFYIIYKGEVEVVVSPDGGKEERVVARLKPGDFFGEMSALTGQPRTATIRAAAPLACVQVEKQDLLAIFERDPAIMEKVSEIVARRNAEREAVMQGGGKAPAPEAVATQQKSILGRMMSFFGLGKAA